jgi:hypothetical protein
MRIKKALCALAFALAWSAPAHGRAQEMALTSEQLGDQRAGLQLPNGLTLDIAAVVRSSLNGALALETHFAWTERGVAVTNAYVSPQASSVAPTPASSSADAPPAGTMPAPPSSGQTATFDSPSGQTTFTQAIEEGALRNVVLNTASDQTIAQELNLQITLHDFTALSERIAGAGLAGLLASDIASAAAAGLR